MSFAHLFTTGDIIECSCWSHSRRYYFKALESDPVRAKHALSFINPLFRLEREWAAFTPELRKQAQLRDAKPLVDGLFAWCEEQAPHVLDATPHRPRHRILPQSARRTSRTFLEDGRLPIHNNFSERELRREAVGRRNWLFLGSDEGGKVNANLVTLLASCQLHGLEPLAYLRDLFCLLPDWPKSRVLELAPAYWQKTLEQPEAQQRLAANVFRQVSLSSLGHPAPK